MESCGRGKAHYGRRRPVEALGEDQEKLGYFGSEVRPNTRIQELMVRWCRECTPCFHAKNYQLEHLEATTSGNFKTTTTSRMPSNPWGFELSGSKFETHRISFIFESIHLWAKKNTQDDFRQNSCSCKQVGPSRTLRKVTISGYLEGTVCFYVELDWVRHFETTNSKIWVTMSHNCMLAPPEDPDTASKGFS